MRVLVTGASGLVGRSLLRLLTADGRQEVFGLARAELDVTDRAAVERTLAMLRPEAVIHCAAFTDVDGAERSPARAMRVNAEGAEWVARAASSVEARVVYLSTDYVFDGEKEAPYTEEDPPRPLSAYGRSKLEGEERVRAVSGDACLILRTGWLYGAGKGFVDWARDRLRAGGSSRFIADQVGSPTWARELARALLSLVERKERGLFHFVNAGQASWLELAREVAILEGRTEVAFEPMSLSDLARPARRPRYSALAVEKYERVTGSSVVSWQHAVAEYVSGQRSTVDT